MLKTNQITNQVTGQVFRFLQTSADTNGKVLEMETVYAPFSDEPPLHYHPQQNEYFKVLAGELTVRLNNEIKSYKPGAVIHIKPGIRHSMWNAGIIETVVNWKVEPALDTEHFLKVMTALANGGHTNNKGIPPLPQMIYILKKHNKSFRLAKPKTGVIGTLYVLLKPVFALCSYKKKFKKVLNAA
ncbi:cupin domain-containing protein [Mucilaginibacter litoreus]|uniref:Cupin domain-containing protein n=1 Tax=Mucilaginibacter litoreus TaxID=1048221 RepID=A0ABW3ANX0_9SPHI